MDQPKMAISGRIAASFQSAQITPLLALVAFLLGVFAVMVKPREEEPQINVIWVCLWATFVGWQPKCGHRSGAAPVAGH